MPGRFEGYDGEAASKDAEGTKRPSPTLPEVWCGDVDDVETQQICWKAYQASLGYFETGLEHRTRVFHWQHLSTRIIFFVVLSLVFAGLFFAWVQFRQGSQDQDHEVEISMQGIKVSSPVLGVIILTLSLAFFYLYLVYVYPIQEIF